MAVLRHVRNMIVSALSRLVYACSESLSTAGPVSVCFHQCAQAKPGAKMLSANIFILYSFISASHDVQMLYNVIQTVNWALLSTDRGFKKVDSLTEGFYENKCVRFCSLPKTRLTQTLGPWVFCLLLPKNKQTFWTGGLKVLSWTYLFQCLETVHRLK